MANATLGLLPPFFVSSLTACVLAHCEGILPLKYARYHALPGGMRQSEPCLRPFGKSTLRCVLNGPQVVVALFNDLLFLKQAEILHHGDEQSHCRGPGSLTDSVIYNSSQSLLIDGCLQFIYLFKFNRDPIPRTRFPE